MNRTKIKLKVCTWNLHAGLDPNFNPSFFDSVEVLKNLRADIIGLQECTKGKHSWERSKDFGFMAEEMSKELNMNYFWGPTIKNTFGNVVLIKKEIFIEKIFDIPLPWKIFRNFKYTLKRIYKLKIPLNERRHVILAYLNFNGFKFKFMNTHLGLDEDERIKQCKELVKLYKKDNLPTILVGDFNEPVFGKAASILLNNELMEVENFTKEKLHTFSANDPYIKIDHIFFTKHFELLEAKVINVKTSDHFPLVAILETRG